MAKCRVYLFTYKRNLLLKRAVQSLLDQTFTDWVCEVHNDLPGDDFPREYIDGLKDHRFNVINHPQNLGTTQSFNLAFNGCQESYASVLEDDNWWESTFLEEMIALLDQNPGISIAWSNMYVWKELPNNEWQDTGKTLWPVNSDVSFKWPHPAQALGSLHSTGAMMYRGNKAHKYIIPSVALSNAVELIRERSFEHPIYLYAKPLANFSRTIITSQSPDTVKWTGTLIMMLASYIKHAPNKKMEFSKTLQHYRNNNPSPIPVFFLAILLYLKDWNLLYQFNLKDWMLIIRWFIANIFKIASLKSYLQSQQATWHFLYINNPGAEQK
jgi:glycosyltransferase involved in cell wall biosynthesis